MRAPLIRPDEIKQEVNPSVIELRDVSVEFDGQQVLKDEFPELAEKITLRTPNEQDKRHGQAVAAASLPVIQN